MPQSQFTILQGSSRELELFPHIKEFALRKNNAITLDSFSVSSCHTLRIYFVVDGKFEWLINQQNYVLYPGDTAIILPGQEMGGSRGYLDVGTIIKLHIQVEKSPSNGQMVLGKWSHLSKGERLAISNILLINNLPVLKIKDAVTILQEIRSEMLSQEIGYVTRVNQMLDSLLIIIARQSTRQAIARRDFPHAFMKLEQALRQNLAHQWSVEEMAAIVGLGTTAFTEKVKNYTGFAPLHYLINIRISEAIKLLKRSGVNITAIALETGFYSSQHFSTTFKKLTGHTPVSFRQKNAPNEQ